LKVVGVTGTIGGFTVGTTAGDGRPSTRLIEVGLRYELDQEHPYSRYHTNQPQPYIVDKANNRMIIPPFASESALEKITNGRAVISGWEMTNILGEIIGQSRTRGLPVTLTDAFLQGFISLDTSVTTPDVRASGQDEDLFIDIEGDTEKLVPGSRRAYTLNEVTVTAETIHVTDERVDNKRVPPAERGLVTEYGTVEVSAVPKIEVHDFGELTPVLLQRE
jgi:hypothetical protein